MNRVSIVLIVWVSGVTCLRGYEVLENPPQATVIPEALDAIARTLNNLSQQVLNKDFEHIERIAVVMHPHFHQMLRTELRFLRKSCQPSAESVAAIEADASSKIKKIVFTFAQHEWDITQGRLLDSDLPALPPPDQVVAQEVRRAAKSSLSMDQFQRFSDEVAARDAARKRAVLLNIVASLDHELVLTVEQRQKITEVLSENWNDTWARDLSGIFHGHGFLPSLPDHEFLSLLDDQQKALWRQLPVRNVFLRGFEAEVPLEVEPMEEQGDANRERAENP